MSTGETSVISRPRFALPHPRVARWEVVGTVALVALLFGWSFLLKVRGVSMSYWIDEGLSTGIASHPLTDIPSVLRQDGSPPLYYMLLHVWTSVFGSGEVSTHWLSMVFGLLCVPAGLWAGWSLFGRTVGLVAAAIAALDPFITSYSNETRMYSLLALMALLGTAFFLHAFVYRRRGYVPLFAVTVTAMLYTHNWSAFFAVGAAAAGLWLLYRSGDRRGILVDGAIAVAVVGVLYAPWVPTLLFQVAHTGAPWTVAPTWRAIEVIPKALFGSPWGSVPLLLGAGVGLWAALSRGRLLQRRPADEDLQTTALAAAAALVAVSILSAWVASKLTPAWAPRYFAVFIGPLVIVLAAALVRARWIGLAALVVPVVLWAIPPSPPRDGKSNARAVAERLSPVVRPGDTVLSTWPEQVPVLHHYLPAGLRYVTPLGPVADPTVMDWREALARFRRSRPATTLEPMLAQLPVGARLVLIRPKLGHKGWSAPWTRLIRTRTLQWTAALATDHRFRLVRQLPRPVPKIASRLRAFIYVKVARS
jgi:hypothetical protein